MWKKQHNSVRKRKKNFKKDKDTPVEYYLCQTMMLLLLKETKNYNFLWVFSVKYFLKMIEIFAIT